MAIRVDNLLKNMITTSIIDPESKPSTIEDFCLRVIDTVCHDVKMLDLLQMSCMVRDRVASLASLAVSCN